MRRHVIGVIGLVLIVVAGCAMLPATEQRTTQGPTADEMWLYRMVLQNGRAPSFDEKRHWQDQIEQSIGDYLRAHPEVSGSLDISNFRFYKRATVGMTKEQVMILLGPPLGITTDAGEMEKLARRYWEAMKGNVTEAWIYPQGWSLYFVGPRVGEITQYLRR